MREGGKKTFRKKNIQPIFWKVSEGDQIKKTLDKFLEKKKKLPILNQVNEGEGKNKQEKT